MTGRPIFRKRFLNNTNRRKNSSFGSGFFRKISKKNPEAMRCKQAGT